MNIIEIIQQLKSSQSLNEKEKELLDELQGKCIALGDHINREGKRLEKYGKKIVRHHEVTLEALNIFNFVLGVTDPEAEAKLKAAAQEYFDGRGGMVKVVKDMMEKINESSAIQ